MKKQWTICLVFLAIVVTAASIFLPDWYQELEEAVRVWAVIGFFCGLFAGINLAILAVDCEKSIKESLISGLIIGLLGPIALRYYGDEKVYAYAYALSIGIGFWIGYFPTLFLARLIKKTKQCREEISEKDTELKEDLKDLFMLYYDLIID